jgi:hypothetical protein
MDTDFETWKEQFNTLFPAEETAPPPEPAFTIETDDTFVFATLDEPESVIDEPVEEEPAVEEPIDVYDGVEIDLGDFVEPEVEEPAVEEPADLEPIEGAMPKFDVPEDYNGMDAIDLLDGGWVQPFWGGGFWGYYNANDEFVYWSEAKEQAYGEMMEWRFSHEGGWSEHYNESARYFMWKANPKEMAREMGVDSWREDLGIHNPNLFEEMVDLFEPDARQAVFATQEAWVQSNLTALKNWELAGNDADALIDAAETRFMHQLDPSVTDESVTIDWAATGIVSPHLYDLGI